MPDFTLEIRVAQQKDKADIETILEICELDSRDLKTEDFLIICDSQKTLGCIRHKMYAGNIVEICSWGVLPEYRQRGLGKQLLKEKIRILKEKKYTDIYVVTAEEKYFIGSGFLRIPNPPDVIQEKIEWCTIHLPYPLPYFAMKLLH